MPTERRPDPSANVPRDDRTISAAIVQAGRDAGGTAERNAARLIGALLGNFAFGRMTL